MCTLKWPVLFGIFVAASCEHFEFGDKPGQPCILMDIDAKFNLTYTENQNDTEVAPEFSLDGAEVVNASSICGLDDKLESVLTLRIFPTQEHVKFRIGSRDQGGDLSMSLTLSVRPREHFQDLNDSIPFEMKDSKNLPAGVYSNDSYLCQAQQQMTFDNQPFSMVVTIRDLQVQAFLVEDARYGPAMECPLDRNTTTVAPETTMTTEPHHETTIMTTEPRSDTTLTTQPHSETTMTSPITTPITTHPHSKTTMTTKPPITIPPAKLHKYVLRDGKQVCVVLQGKISFEIPYMKKGGKSDTATVNVPTNTVVGGNCNFNKTNTEQEITVSFYNGWEMIIMIVKDGKPSGGIVMLDDNDDNDYSWQKISLTYIIDDNFPDASNTGQNNTVVQIDTFGQFKANMEGSYRCVAKQQVTLQTEIKLDLSEFQYRAFGTSTTDDFSSNGVSECAADDANDKNNDKTLAIVLGAGFGGLAVLIILAGLIFKFRRQKQRGTYEEI